MLMRVVVTPMALAIPLWIVGLSYAVDAPTPEPVSGQEAVPPDETQDIEKLSKLQEFLMKNVPRLKGRRGQHPKHHGCVVATFTVNPDIPNELKQGLFRSPGTYQAVIRFSNGGNDEDTKPDVHGMAVKLVGVRGERASADADERETQDFVMLDNPVFFVKNVKQMVEFAGALAASKAQPSNMEPMKKFAAAHPEEAKLARQATSRFIGNPLRVQYFSTTPYRLGSAVVKYTARPSDVETPPASAAGTDENYLRQAMVERLSSSKEPVVFDLLAIRQTDAASQPIEDPTVEWKTEPVKVATITIPPQGFSSDEQLKFCEDLSYSPWHALSDHRPLGGINRARKPVYRMSTELRHSTSGAARTEPTAEILSRFRRPAP